jgi:hypothetical protein
MLGFSAGIKKGLDDVRALALKKVKRKKALVTKVFWLERVESWASKYPFTATQCQIRLVVR